MRFDLNSVNRHLRQTEGCDSARDKVDRITVKRLSMHTLPTPCQALNQYDFVYSCALRSWPYAYAPCEGVAHDLCLSVISSLEQKTISMCFEALCLVMARTLLMCSTFKYVTVLRHGHLPCGCTGPGV